MERNRCETMTAERKLTSKIIFPFKMFGLHIVGACRDREPPGGALSDFYNCLHGNAVIKMPNTRGFHRVKAEEKKDIGR